jgi:hypothetical protein
LLALIFGSVYAAAASIQITSTPIRTLENNSVSMFGHQTFGYWVGGQEADGPVVADGRRVRGVQGKDASRRPGSSCEARAVSVSSTRALAAPHREPLGDAAAGSEDVLLLGLLGADDQF